MKCFFIHKIVLFALFIEVLYEKRMHKPGLKEQICRLIQYIKRCKQVLCYNKTSKIYDQKNRKIFTKVLIRNMSMVHYLNIMNLRIFSKINLSVIVGAAYNMHSSEICNTNLGYFKSSAKNQFLVTICANLLILAFGASCGWISFLVLESESSQLESGPMTSEELSWIVSVFCFGGIAGNFLFGWLANKLGRKLLLYILAMPQLLSWLLIIFAKTPVYLLISRLLVGISGGGSFVIVPIIVAEVSEDRVRGGLGSILCLSANGGTLLTFIVGHFFEYKTIPKILVVLPILFIISMAFFPETPYRLLNVGKLEEAEKSLQFYRNMSSKIQTTEYVREELNQLKLRFQTTQKIASNISWQDFTRKAARKGFLISIAIILMSEFSGAFILICYTHKIFVTSGSILSPNLSAIIVGILQFFGTYVSTIYVDKIGRKFLLEVSTIGTGIGNFCLGFYMYSTVILGYDLSSFSWIPIISFSMILFLAAVGIVPLTFVILTEFLPEKIRGVGSAICLSISWFLGFIILKYFATISLIIGMYSCMFVFAICCFLGALFVIYVMPETKGRSFAEIQKKLES